jgi:N-acetylmuramoyl-L-alanine amidase
MKKSTKKLAIAAIALAAFTPFAAARITKTYTQETAVEQTETVASAAILRQGSKGGEVKEVQRRLKLWGYYSGSVDGVFGAGTRAAVNSFQKKNAQQHRMRISRN